MLTHAPSPADIAGWKRIYREYGTRLKPNRKTGAELYEYLQSRYALRALSDHHADQVVIQNVLQNEALARELPNGILPDPVCCIVANAGNGEALCQEQDACFKNMQIFVGIDLVSGHFLVEGSSLLWDDLYAFRGLNETDLSNFYCVAEYIFCLKRFGLLAEALAE